MGVLQLHDAFQLTHIVESGAFKAGGVAYAADEVFGDVCDHAVDQAMRFQCIRKHNGPLITLIEAAIKNRGMSKEWWGPGDFPNTILNVKVIAVLDFANMMELRVVVRMKLTPNISANPDFK